MQYPISHDFTLFSDYDIYLFKEGKHTELYKKFGAHFVKNGKKEGVYFSVWAPNAKSVSVRGDFNDYDTDSHPLKLREDESGIWEGFIEGIEKGLTYKYHIRSKFHNIVHDKSDPYGFYWETPPKSATKIWNIEDYKWQDEKWMEKRHKHNALNAPISIYEIHLGSWRRKVEEDNRYLTYRELADELAEYLKEMNYTHIELLPVTEHPFEGSWGYQVTGYYAPTARFGTPQDFMYFVEKMHQNGIGVIMDWVPSHFAVDMHGLINFDGTALYEHEDPRQGYHPEWGSIIFNYGRNEVKSFLISNALFWLEKYHIDGIRVDAVASMLYLNYARKEGEWIPNKYGGNENLEAIEFLKELNVAMYTKFNDIVSIAEESTAWPMVTKPPYMGGLGFEFKWNMGWMHDTLSYFKKDPIFRQFHHDRLTFTIWYAFDENFLLPLSHDEVVHMKGSLINKMPGLYDDKFANLRALFAYMTAHPGKKLLFMGGEIAQFSEWNYKQSLDWNVLDYPLHRGVQKLISDLNKLYQEEEALYLYDVDRKGFEWIDYTDHQNNIISFMRKSDKESIIIVCNFSPVERIDYRIGVSEDGMYREIFNSDSSVYGGRNVGNMGGKRAEKIPMHGKEYSLNLTLPPLGVLYLKK